MEFCLIFWPRVGQCCYLPLAPDPGIPGLRWCMAPAAGQVVLEPRLSRSSGPRVRTESLPSHPGTRREERGLRRFGVPESRRVPFAALPETPPPSGQLEPVSGPFLGQPGGSDQPHGPPSGGDPDLHLVPWIPNLLTPPRAGGGVRGGGFRRALRPLAAVWALASSCKQL